MRVLVRSAEALHGILIVLGLAAPLALFFARVGWGGRGADDIMAFFAQPTVINAIINSLTLALSTAAASTALAFFFSWLLWRFRWSAGLGGTLSLLLKIPYLLPPFFFAMGWIALAAPGVGYLNRLGLPLPSIYGLAGAGLVMTLWSTAFAMIQLQTFFTQFPGTLEDAAIICGASPRQTFLKITVPLARTQLASCFLLTTVSVLAAFGVPALLASPERRYVITTKIFQGIKSGQDFSEAGLLSLALLVFTIALLGAQRVFARRAPAVPLVAGKATRPAALEPGRGARALYAGAWVFALWSCVIPCVAIAMQSLLRDPSDLSSWTLERFAYVFGQVPDGLNALKNSVLTAAAAAGAATLLGLVLAYGAARLKFKASRFLTEVWAIGYALPGTVIALALLVFYGGTLTDTLWILIIAYTVKYAAFALSTLTPATGAISRELEEAAWMAGATPRRAFFRVIVPMLRPALAAAMLLALVPMLSELTMSVFLVGTGTETLGSLIYRFREYSDPGSAAVLAVVVAAAILVLNSILKRFSKGSFGI